MSVFRSTHLPMCIKKWKEKFAVHLKGDSSISKKSLFMGTRESRRTRAQNRLSELSTCRMHGMHSSKCCICWLAPLPCLLNKIKTDTQFPFGIRLDQRIIDDGCIYTLELPSNPIGRPGPFLSISSRGPCSRLGRHSWPARGPSGDSTPHGSPTAAPAAGLFARTAWKKRYFIFNFISFSRDITYICGACTQKEIWSDWATNLEEEFFHAAFACFLLVHAKVSRPLQFRIGTVQRDGAEGQRQGQYLRPARLQQPHLVVEGHFQKPCHVKEKNKKKGKGRHFPITKGSHVTKAELDSEGCIHSLDTHVIP